MRLNTTLFTVGVLLGTALADIFTIRASLLDVNKRATELSKAILNWPGTATSGGDMLCKTVALRKSLDACTKAFQTSKPLKNGEVSKNGLPLVRLANAMFELKDSVVKTRPEFDRVGATAPMFEMIKAQQAPASEMSKAMKVVVDKLPPGFRNTKVPLTNQNSADFAQNFMNKEINDLLEKLQPRPEQQSLLTPFVLMAAKFSESIDLTPFCLSVPKVMELLAGQKSISLGELTDKLLKVLDSSGVQDMVPLDIIRQNANIFGVPPNVIPNVLKAFRASEKGLPLRAFTQMVPGLLKTFKLNNIVIDPSRITRFINFLVEIVLGSPPR